jgi:hypothetical protein
MTTTTDWECNPALEHEQAVVLPPWAVAILEPIARTITFAMYVGIAELIRLAWHTARAVFAL